MNLRLRQRPGTVLDQQTEEIERLWRQVPFTVAVPQQATLRVERELPESGLHGGPLRNRNLPGNSQGLRGLCAHISARASGNQPAAGRPDTDGVCAWSVGVHLGLRPGEDVPGRHSADPATVAHRAETESSSNVCQ